MDEMATRVIPILPTKDVAAAVQWYEHYGFEVMFEHRFEPHLPAYVGIKRDDAEIHLSEHTGDIVTPGWSTSGSMPSTRLLRSRAQRSMRCRGRVTLRLPIPTANRLRFAEPVAG